MEIVLVNCNGCGASLDVGPGTRFATCAQCGARLAVKRSETAAYTEILEGLERKTDAIAEQLAEIQQQNELERIDREWEQERERYMVSRKNGHRVEPSATMGYIMAGFAVIVGVIWIGSTLSMGAPGEFACFGVAFIGLMIGFAFFNVVKAKEYEEAQRRYRKRRAAAMHEKPG